MRRKAADKWRTSRLGRSLDILFAGVFLSPFSLSFFLPVRVFRHSLFFPDRLFARARSIPALKPAPRERMQNAMQTPIEPKEEAEGKFRSR
jgi:hypothetical protein